LAPRAFISGPAARYEWDRIIFDVREQCLSYDPDGSGPSAAVRFAKFTEPVTIGFSDFLIV
jgi:hypothetical protein